MLQSTPVVKSLKLPFAKQLKAHVRLSKPPSGLRRSQGGASVQPATTKLIKLRIEQHPDVLTVDAGVLWCKACKEAVIPHKTNTSTHINSKKHEASVTAMANVTANSVRLQKGITQFTKAGATEAIGSTRDAAETMCRVKIVRSFLAAGVPIEKLDKLRPLLQEYMKHRLTSAPHLRLLVPCIEQTELQHVQEEVAKEYIAVISDGTTRDKMAEVLAVVVRYALHA